MDRVFDRVGVTRNKGCVSDFLHKTDGATTADFVMITAMILGVGMAALLSVGGGTSEAASDVGTEIAAHTPGQMNGQYTSATWGSPAPGQDEFTTEAELNEMPEEDIASLPTAPTEITPGDGTTPQPSDPGTSSEDGTSGGSVVVVSGGTGDSGDSGGGAGSGLCEREEEGDDSSTGC